jgi:hypothetical protein
MEYALQGELGVHDAQFVRTWTSELGCGNRHFDGYHGKSMENSMQQLFFF